VPPDLPEADPGNIDEATEPTEPGEPDGTAAGPADFFISYTGADAEWAEWVAWLLEDAGYTTRIQAWDFNAGSNFVRGMHQGARDSARTIAVLSNAYLTSDYAEAEWQAAWARDPSGRGRKLLAVRTEDCARPGLLTSLVTVDLFDVDRKTAASRLLAAAHGARGKPAAEPAFPGAAKASVTPPRAEPAFPGGKRPRVGSGRHRRAWHARRPRSRRTLVNALAYLAGIVVLLLAIILGVHGGAGSDPAVRGDALPGLHDGAPQPQSAPTVEDGLTVVPGRSGPLAGLTPSPSTPGTGMPAPGVRDPGASAGSAAGANPGPRGTSPRDPAAPAGIAETTSQQAPASQAGPATSQAGPATQPAASPTPTSGCKDGVPLSPLLGGLGLVHC
jgi:hypothetical protein